MFLLRSVPALQSLGRLYGVIEAVETIAQELAQEPVGEARGAAALCLDTLVAGEASRRQAEAVVLLCPALGNLTLQRPQPGVLSLLAGLPGLHSLDLDKFPPRELLRLLETVGARLTSLVLGEVWDEDWDDDNNLVLALDRVAVLCPVLESLSCDVTMVSPSGSVPWPALRTFSREVYEYDRPLDT